MLENQPASTWVSASRRRSPDHPWQRFISLLAFFPRCLPPSTPADTAVGSEQVVISHTSTSCIPSWQLQGSTSALIAGLLPLAATCCRVVDEEFGACSSLCKRLAAQGSSRQNSSVAHTSYSLRWKFTMRSSQGMQAVAVRMHFHNGRIVRS